MNKNSYRQGKRRNKPQSFFLLVLLFILATIIPPVVAELSNPTPIVQTQQNPTQLVTQAQETYQNRQFEKAVPLWEQAAQAFADSGSRLNQAMALSNLSLTYQQLGQWEEAQQTIKQSLEILENEPQEQQQAQVLAQTLDIQGRLQRQRGQAAQAIDTWQQANQIYLQINELSQAAQNKFNQAQAMQDLGLYPRACKTLLESLGNSFADLTCPPLEQPISGQQNSEILTPQQLTERIRDIKKTDLSLLTVKALRSLGDVLRVLGQQEQSQTILTNSLGLAEKLNSSQNIAEISAIYLSLGNTVRNIQDTAVCNLDNDASIPQSLAKETLGLPNEPEIPCTKIALAYYQQAENRSLTNISKVKAQLNRLSLLVENPQLQWIEISTLSNKIQSELEELTNSRAGIYARVNLAQSLICLNTRLSQDNSKDQLEFSPIVHQCTLPNLDNQINRYEAPQPEQITSWEDIEQILTPALTEAKNLENKQLEAYVLGYLGGIAQQKEKYSEAKKLTQQALDLDSRNQWANVSYRWDWQLGRLNQIQGKPQDAIDAYTSALENLKSLRGDLVVINRDLQFNFRDSVEPVYRELADLLLREENPSQETLIEARETIEALKTAELDNFFRDTCATIEEVNVREIDPKAGFIYSIALPDRLEIILELPNRPLRHYSTVSFDDKTKTFESEINSQINILRNLIEDKRRKPQRKNYETEQILNLSQQIYGWLFDSDAKTELKNSSVETLVFLMNDVLQNIPIAILHDGEQYLIQKGYRLAITPGLQLLPPKRLEQEEIKVLVAGRSKFKEREPKPELQDLDNVENELKIIAKEFPGKMLLNQDFIRENLDLGINSLVPPVVHIATHSQFGSQLEDTYIIEWDGYIDPQNLADLMQVNDSTKQSDIELLVLSACQTAVGDDRAALGMAGLAVRSGVRSTLATLWNIADDSTTKLMVKFYEELNNSSGKQVEKAEALRLAQIWLLDGEEGEEYKDPFYWAPFVLVGNWL